jgi:hypothetical protein
MITELIASRLAGTNNLLNLQGSRYREVLSKMSRVCLNPEDVSLDDVTFMSVYRRSQDKPFYNDMQTARLAPFKKTLLDIRPSITTLDEDFI